MQAGWRRDQHSAHLDSQHLFKIHSSQTVANDETQAELANAAVLLPVTNLPGDDLSRLSASNGSATEKQAHSRSLRARGKAQTQAPRPDRSTVGSESHSSVT